LLITFEVKDGMVERTEEYDDVTDFISDHPGFFSWDFWTKDDWELVKVIAKIVREKKRKESTK
jgi:hypothetical protein